MITDRQRAELVFIVGLFLDVVMNGAEGPTTAQSLADLREAAEEPLRDLLPESRNKIRRRAAREHDRFMRLVRVEDSLVAKVGLVSFHLLNTLTESGYFVIADDSAFMRGLTPVLGALGEVAETEPLLDASARKQAAKALGELRKAGYFPA